MENLCNYIFPADGPTAGHQTFSRQRATPVTVSCTWKNNSNGTPNCLNYCVIFRV